MTFSPGSRSPASVRRGGFTLLEMIVVIAIIAILLALLAPAMSSFTKSSARKNAARGLVGALEEARSTAIKDRVAAYVVFPTFASGTQATVERYNCRSYATFEDNRAGGQKQLTSWKTFATGVAFRVASLATLPDSAALTPAAAFSFTPDTAASTVFRCIKFNSDGEIEQPPSNVTLLIFEGYVNGGTEVITSAKDSSGNPTAVEKITLTRLTGRAATS